MVSLLNVVERSIEMNGILENVQHLPVNNHKPDHV